MAHPCCVQFCTNIGTHQFPKEETVKNRWIQAIKVKPSLTLRRNSLICSSHFRPTDIAVSYVSGRARKTIKKNAVPSIFEWNQQQDEIFEELIFDPLKVQATYSRPPPIQFIEAYPFMDVPTKEEDDPLQVSDQKADYEQAEIVGNDIIPNQAENEESVQTQTNEFNSQQNQGISKETQTPDNSFSINKYKNDDKTLHFYTGLECFEKFMLVFKSRESCRYMT